MKKIYKFYYLVVCYRGKGSINFITYYKCNTCAKIFKKKRNLRRHMLTHTSICDISCDKCDSMFISKDTLVQHKGKVHYLPCVYICPTCTKECRTKDKLKTHVTKHSNIRAFPCRDLCGFRKRFKTTKARNAHEKLDSKAHNKPFLNVL